MMMKWSETIFDDLARLNRGFDLPNHKIEEGKYPVVASTSVKAFHKQFKIKGPGVVTGRSGSLGAVQYVSENFWPLNTSLYVKDFKGNNKRFVAYFLETMRLENFNSGAGVPTLNQNHLHKLSVRIPPLSTQCKIVAVLSAYDDLIEVNQRRIALLEKMAEEIYREWFVRMRFPGYRNTRFVKGVPKGWEIRQIGELCSTVTDGSHYSPNFVENGKPMASVKDMNPHGFDLVSVKRISDVDFDKLKKGDCQPLKNDVLIAKDGSYLKHVFVWGGDYEIVILSSIAILRPNLLKIKPYFFSQILKQGSTKSMMTGYVSGSALPRIILKDFKKMKLLVPTTNLINQYETVVSTIFQDINVILKQNINLVKTRDLLLPRLISGKLSVEDLDIQFPPSMAEEVPPAAAAKDSGHA